jgi:hypothetical protein
LKKTVVIFFTLLHFVVSTGFAQYSHSCEAMAVKVVRVTNSDYKNAAKPCPICSEKENVKQKKKNCCKHEVEIVKLDEVAKQQSGLDISVKFLGETIPANMLGAVFDSSLDTFKPQNSSPYLSSKVPLRGNPLYILHCVHRI